MPNKMHLGIVGRKYDYAYGYAACGALTYTDGKKPRAWTIQSTP